MSSDPFADWYAAAGVRGGPRRRLRDEAEQGLVYFPEKLVPYLDHELVVALGPETRRDLTIRHLYQFLLATTHLETRVVNRGAERIANNRIGMNVPAAARMDAFKIYCDEGYHALYSLDLADQIAAVTGVEIPAWEFGGFTARLDATAARLMPSAPVLAQLLQVIVFETLITAVLNEVPIDPTVVTTVRELTRDHARDEGRHHRFFNSFFHELWSGLGNRQREQVAVTMPAFIDDCLTFDTAPASRSLALAGLSSAQVKDVLRDTFDGPKQLRENAAATVRMCRSAGVFEVPGAWEAFADKGIVDG